MKMMQMGLVAFIVAGFGTAALAEDKADNKKLLVGRWESVKVAEGTLPKGAIVEFLKSGQFTATQGDKKILDGTYSVDGEAFTLVFKIEDKEIKMKIKIKKLNETDLDTENQEGKGVTFKRAK